MRTNIIINDGLMEEALRLSGLPTKRAVVEEGLRMLIHIKRQTQIRDLKGKVTWEGNLEALRASRTDDRRWSS